MKIEDFNNKNTFNLPEGYFDSLQERIASQTCKAEKAEPLKRRKTFSWRSVSYAASILLVAVIGKFAYERNNTIPDYTADTESYDREYMESMLASYPIDDYTFYCYLTDTDMNQ